MGSFIRKREVSIRAITHTTTNYGQIYRIETDLQIIAIKHSHPKRDARKTGRKCGLNLWESLLSPLILKP